MPAGRTIELGGLVAMGSVRKTADGGIAFVVAAVFALGGGLVVVFGLPRRIPVRGAAPGPAPAPAPAAPPRTVMAWLIAG